MTFPLRCRICRVGGLGQDDSSALVLRTAAGQDEDVRRALEDPGEGITADDIQGMEESIKSRAIKNAMTSIGAQLAIMAIPGVGQAIAGVVGGITALTGKKYTEKLKRHIEKKKEWLENYVAKKKEALHDALDDAYKSAYRKALPLARSWQKLEVGPDEGFFDRSFEGMCGIIDRVTGRDIYSQGRDKMNALVNKAVKQINSAVDPIIAKVKQPAFRSLLAKQIAIEMRRQPGFLAAAKKHGAPPPSKYLDPQARAATIQAKIPPATDKVAGGETSMAPLLIGGGLLAAVLLLR